MQLLFPPFRLDLINEQLWRDNDFVELRAKPFAILRYLAEHPGRLISHEEMRRAIWPTTHVGEGVLRVYLREVRAALGDDAATPKFVKTIARRGYRFLPVIERREAPPGSALRAAGAQKPLLVGRDNEFGELRDAFFKASTGIRQVVLINGEAGIGKSSLLEAFLNEVGGSNDVWIGRGQCVEHRGEGEPYLPVLDALRQLCNQDGGARVVELLRKNAPTWLAQMPGVVDDRILNDLVRVAGGASQHRMLREIAEALEQIGTYRVVVLACEDLHWSDPSTLTLFDLLARRVELGRIMLIGTHRPTQTLSADHPLRALVSELSGRYCVDLSPPPLNDGQIAEYLANRMSSSYSDSGAISRIARAIQQRCEGNPLFMVTLTAALLDADESSVAGNANTLASLLDRSDRILPSSVREMIAQQFAQIDPGDQRLLEIASVAGVEFSAASVAAAFGEELANVEERCARLANRMSFIRDAGDDELPDGTVASRFRFGHALHQEIVYGRLTVARRSTLHSQIGKRLEDAYMGRAEQIAPELARHFAQARDFPRAVAYHKQSARNALRQSAPREAIQHLNEALAALDRLPTGPERIQHELDCRLALGAALQSTLGYGAPEVENTYERAGELCHQLGETPQLFPSLLGMWSYAVGRGEWRQSCELAERNLRLAGRIQETAQLARAWRALGHCLFFLGRFQEAREKLEHAILLTEQPHHPPLDEFTYTTNTGVDARSALSWTLELLGYPDKALDAIRKALSLAERLCNMHDLTYASFFAAVLYGFRTDWANTESWARRTVELAAEHGLPYYAAMGSHMLGIAASEQGKVAEGIAMMRQAIQTTQAIGVESGISAMHLMIAQAALKGGLVREGLDAISDGMEFANRKHERAWEPELHRVRGELLLEQFRHGQSIKGVKRGDNDAEDCFISAREVARAQQSRKWEMRAALSLSDLYRHQRRRREARQVLSESYKRFTEGFEMPELKTAKKALDELGADARN